MSSGNSDYNLSDRPEKYQGSHRHGDDTRANMESDKPVVFLGIETVEGLGDSVIAASMSFRTTVSALQDFSNRVEGQEIFPERVFLPDSGTVRMRNEQGEPSSYRIEPVSLL